MSGITRRTLLSSLAAVGLVPTAMTASVGAQGMGSDLRVLSWEGYQDGAFHTQFLDAHGASPSYAVMLDEADAFSKLRGGYLADVAQPCA